MTENRGPGWQRQGRRDVYIGLLEGEVGKPILISHARNWLLSPENQMRIRQHLSRYLTVYSGRHFETLASRGDGPTITPWDVLAAESLSISIPADVVLWFTHAHDKRDNLLRSLHESLIVKKQKLWTCEERFLNDGEELSKIYKMLKQHRNMGYVKSSKLLAAKFPEVVPIRDSKVEKLLGLSKSEHWWLDIRELFLDEGEVLATHLDGLVIPDGLGRISTLRRLDIILWMEAKARQL